MNSNYFTYIINKCVFVMTSSLIFRKKQNDSILGISLVDSIS